MVAALWLRLTSLELSLLLHGQHFLEFLGLSCLGSLTSSCSSELWLQLTLHTHHHGSLRLLLLEKLLDLRVHLLLASNWLGGSLGIWLDHGANLLLLNLLLVSLDLAKEVVLLRLLSLKLRLVLLKNVLWLTRDWSSNWDSRVVVTADDSVLVLHLGSLSLWLVLI